jgi:formate hydrogenlyase subunit 6/NADH:ubiquinone oxidoreductase subunit I
MVPKPVIVESGCTACGTCVKACPVDPVAVDWPSDQAMSAKEPPVHDYDACIRCYCCQEMCPEHTIVIETPLLGRLLNR